MKGYPKHIATKQDFLNLLAMPEYKAQALAVLQAIVNLNDDTALFAVRQRRTELFNVARELVDLETGVVDSTMQQKLETYLHQPMPKPRIAQKSVTSWGLAAKPLEPLVLEDDHGTIRAYRADSDDEWETTMVVAPLPVWKQKGFSSRQEVVDLIAQAKLEAKK